ncbi:MAG TPA: tripartite tricarboxylate transporter substrate binding protein, partial [Burkholderiaceae bacterium]|nr:tripartite tricarboxylate transporter substrate binding protein [Burkholderiaceae bacterium]
MDRCADRRDAGVTLGRRDLLAAAAAIAAAHAMPATAQSGFPQRPLKFIIPNAPASSVDTIGRVLMSELAKLLQQPAVADNRAGAAGALGVEAGRTS